MKHAVIEHSYLRPFERIVSPAARRRRVYRPARQTGHSAAATRFAEICAGIGGTTMLHDLMPDVVTVSFGSRTDAICKRLHARGWDFVGTGAWQGERVLGVSFAGDRRANATVEELAEALIRVVGEIDVAETRLW